ncbi:Crp/Fnr family transcriptional regulator [Flammeovirgaceae bacterium SG7u.111]|nr:Crp/Fnr family transcriptional regulator [Flammeovirgaceae bacterium SG7u.132]WPO37583.1 Crp/Fnr family transcriptional regulator [Flammeovirgaceae bacterium SG7u.111]
MLTDKEKYYNNLRSKFESYHPISDASWELLKSISLFEEVRKEELVVRISQVAKKVFFICKGALRASFLDSEGNSYNKNLFLEGDLAGSTVSMLLNEPSKFEIEALEDSLLISLKYGEYRKLINEHDDLKNYYIAYLEKNWVIEKEQREVSIVMENAKERYLKLLAKHPNINKRIPQLHIASHLGITPTQLSRIRKSLK